MRRRPPVHMYVPPRLLPLYVFLVGRRQCCGARRTAAHLDYCRRRPCSRGPEKVVRVPAPAAR